MPSARASTPAAVVRASAPGRVNLIGEHTDYNEGFVLPMPIPQETTVELRVRDDARVILRSRDEAGEGTYVLGQESRSGAWIDYVQGVTQALARHGHALRGFEASYASSVPIGAGLSSSAAIEIATLRALRSALGLRFDDVTAAKLGQMAEVDLVGAPTGIMDQMASSLGKQGSALFIDTRTLETRTVEFPEELELVVIDSGVKHAHGTGGYRTRRAECERAALGLGVRSLRDLTPSQLERSVGLEPLLLRRARHVVTENERVLRTVDALAACDVPALRRLFAESHASMRDDFEVSIREIDLLVELAGETASIHAARLTGGGFGGSVVMLGARGQSLSAAREIAEAYARKSGQHPTVLLPPEA